MSLATTVQPRRRLRALAIFVFTLLVIEFVDEFVYGAREAAWPIIKSELRLSYDQIGLLLSIPGFFGGLIEPVLGILADTWRRRVIILGGGILFALSLVLTALSQSFLPLMIGFMAFSPASGAFVSLSQSTLMDVDPTRHEHNMARWTFAGSLGVVCGSLIIGALGAFGAAQGGWRLIFALSGGLSFALVLSVWRLPFPKHPAHQEGETIGFVSGLKDAFRALRRGEVLRWLTLLHFSDLMLDVLHGYLALYFVDVVGVSAGEASVAVAVWTVVGLLGDFLLIPLLERVRGLTYLRYSILAELILFPAFLLAPGLLPKLIILGLLGLFNSGWYSILQGQLYSAMPGKSGTVLTVNNLFGLFGAGFIPLLIGMAAERLGLGAAIWLCWLGPIVLMIGLPRQGRDEKRA